MRAVMYPRVSSDIQRGNYSVPSQIKDMILYAEEKRYTLVGDRFVDPTDGSDCENVKGAVPAYVDDYTSTEFSRPGLDACLSFLAKVGFDVLIVHAIDRLARDPYIRQTIEREVNSLGARVEYVLGNYEESPEGEVRKDLDATFAKWENAKRVERSNRGKKRKAEMGKFVSGRAPYGYRIDIDSPGGLAIYEPEAEIVRLIFRLYVEEKYSLHQIVNELKRLKIKTYHEYTSWAHGTVAKMLRNSIYAGYGYYNQTQTKDKKQVKRDRREWIKITCTPIIESEIFTSASEILKYNKENIRKKGKRFYLLGGMVFCSKCERVYNSQTIRFNTPYPHSQAGYRHRISQGHCSNKWISSHKIEPQVWEKVVEILLDPTSLRRGYERMIREEAEKQKHQIKHLETLNTALQKIQAKRARLQALYLDPDIGMTKDEYLHEKKELDGQLETIQGDIARIEEDLAKIPTPEGLENLEEMAGSMRELLGSSVEITEADKRSIMEMLNLKVFVSPDKDRKIKVEGWFIPQNGLLSPSSWSRRNHRKQ